MFSLRSFQGIYRLPLSTVSPLTSCSYQVLQDYFYVSLCFLSSFVSNVSVELLVRLLRIQEDSVSILCSVTGYSD
jgi:hypothetical protein